MFINSDNDNKEGFPRFRFIRRNAIVRAGVGVDNIDVAAATRKGIVVMNTPGGNTVSTAEHTIALMMALARHIPAADASLQAGKWDRSKFVGTQLAGKTLGVIGLGRIGREVARRAAGLDMKVIGFDPFFAPDFAGKLGIETAADLDELLPQVDFLTVHTPLSPETTNLIGASEIALMKKGAPRPQLRPRRHHQRGGAGRGAASPATSPGAALDVFVQEPPPADHPLLKLPNVVVTPHLGASTVEAQESVALEAAQLLIDFLTQGRGRSSPSTWPRSIAPSWRRCGCTSTWPAASACCTPRWRRARSSGRSCTYRGEVARRSTKLITAAFAAGLLEYRLAQNVNIVNAELLARERGIEIVEQSVAKKGDFSTLIQAEVDDRQEDLHRAPARSSATSTCAWCSSARTTSTPTWTASCCCSRHRDVPGLIGFIGTIFGKHDVNIAQMTVGRQQPGGEAIAVLNLDSQPPEEALKEVQAHPQISSLSVVKLPPAGEMPPWFG